ncbi:toxin-antitoxin system [Nocardia carnea]|uniref:toxin-antitoxin system n=1 Tax=Nocardia carnea TaxID=37328 RepID=UPI0024571FC4|nr:toxin-antitoxin system [Nocardia carnea]
MAQLPKGERAQVGPRLALEVFEAVRRLAEENEMSMSQYVADVMALHVDRPDLVLELNKPRHVPRRAQPKKGRRRKPKKTDQQELPLAG